VIGEENLLLVLRALHVQAIAIQVTARVLGWWKGDMLVAFLPWKFTTWNFDKMIENGIRINELPWHLKHGTLKLATFLSMSNFSIPFKYGYLQDYFVQIKSCDGL
jgi:hypothetical protein